MQSLASLDGKELVAMFQAGTCWLEKIVPAVNALNVYPVPDGDCGTNMLLTMRASLGEAAKLNGQTTVSAAVDAMARGALMGARGNSGVILSQIWRGIREGLKGNRTIMASDLARALREASDSAYRALSKPVEGTILTVIRDAATAAEKEASRRAANLISVLEAAVDAARESVVNTPNLLSVLRDAGVVDAGGHGLYTLLQGALFHLKGDTGTRTPEVLATQLPVKAESGKAASEEESYGYCTQFMLKSDNLEVETLRSLLEGMGKSLIVVGDGNAVRVHIHTLDPESVTGVASSFGELLDVDINNMDDQHKEFLLMHRGEARQLDAAIVAVANGNGMINIFSDLNTSAVVPGGQTMNPSTMDILQAVQEVPSDKVIILPNNKNVIPTANLVQSLTAKTIRVIPTETVPQGISALVAFIQEDTFEANVASMAEAAKAVRTLEITRATRDTVANGLEVKQGQVIGLLDGELLEASEKPVDVILHLLTRCCAEQASLVTLYYGKDINTAEAEQAGAGIREHYPHLEVGIVSGGQPNYDYIMSVE